MGYQQATAMAPLFWVFFAKIPRRRINARGLMQLRQAFQCWLGYCWFIFSYKEIAAWQATVTRLYHFVVLLEHDHQPEITELDDKQN